MILFTTDFVSFSIEYREDSTFFFTMVSKYNIQCANTMHTMDTTNYEHIISYTKILPTSNTFTTGYENKTSYKLPFVMIPWVIILSDCSDSDVFILCFTKLGLVACVCVFVLFRSWSAFRFENYFISCQIQCFICVPSHAVN